MTEILFNTTDVAKMLQVDKSTVKRWTDDGKLKCFRTPGGHRKFRAEDLYQFIMVFHYGISPVNLFPQLASDEAVIRRIIAKREYKALESVCFSAAIKGQKSEILKLFSEVYKNGLTLPLIFDEILQPTLKRLSDAQLSGKISQAESQLATTAMSSALILLAEVVVRPAPNGKRAICAAIEDPNSDIKLKAISVLLESEGYEVLNLGATVTTESLLQLLLRQRSQVIFLYKSKNGRDDNFVTELQKVKEAALPLNTRLIVSCGLDLDTNVHARLVELSDRVCHSFKEIADVEYELITTRTMNVSESKN